MSYIPRWEVEEREAALALAMNCSVCARVNRGVRAVISILVIMHGNAHTMRILYFSGFLRVSHYAVDKTRLLTKQHSHRMSLSDKTLNSSILYPDLRSPYEDSR